ALRTTQRGSLGVGLCPWDSRRYGDGHHARDLSAIVAGRGKRGKDTQSAGLAVASGSQLGGRLRQKLLSAQRHPPAADDEWGASARPATAGNFGTRRNLRAPARGTGTVAAGGPRDPDFAVRFGL